MDSILSIKGLNSFTSLLDAYQQAGVGFRNFIDGGAGMGTTARSMLRFLPEKGHVYAFEPFSGNWRFFKEEEKAIILFKAALSDQSARKHFHVSSVVKEDSEWGRRGSVGYSSVGYLVERPLSPNDVVVPCVRADEMVPAGETVDFVKLDLQGGEFNAIRGMESLLENVKVMWVEYGGQDGLIEYLYDLGFILFDTEYMFMGNKSDSLMNQFRITKDNVPLSIGTTAWFGTRTRPWRSFEEEFTSCKQKFGLIQTDLVCVNKRHIDAFMRSCAHL